MYGMGAAIALLVTALLGIAGYVVQNKASITANATQHKLVQEAAERQRAEDRAGKQLERVQIQNAELVYPVGTLINQFWPAFTRAALECASRVQRVALLVLPAFWRPETRAAGASSPSRR